MIRHLCVYASPVAVNKWRDCSQGKGVNGKCRHLKECWTCDGYVSGTAQTVRVALPVIAECVNGGTDADIIERCGTCNGGAKHVRECAVHGKCTHEPVSPAVMDCSKCRREKLGFVAKS